MNRGVLQSLPVQQMMAGSPNWWNINTNMRSPSHDQINLLLPSSLSSSSSSYSSSSSSSPSPSSIFPPPLPPNSLLMNHCHDTHELPDQSWSQLLMSGLVGEEDRCSFNHFQHKKTENWTDHVMYCTNGTMVDVKQESSDQGGYLRGHDQNSEEIQALKSQCGQVLPACSPISCVTTTLSNNLLDFSSSKGEEMHQQQPDHSLECNSSQTGSAYKKARVRSTPQSAFKVRKENLGDRITALHQLVSPFGKTDTASVLLEAIGYIRFLQNQIEALSSPYLGSASISGTKRQPIQAAERNSVFPEDPGQLLEDACIKRRGGQDQEGSYESGEPRKDLRSRGLCLVPVACTMQVGSDNGADYWAPAPPAFGGGFH